MSLANRVTVREFAASWDMAYSYGPRNDDGPVAHIAVEDSDLVRIGLTGYNVVQGWEMPPQALVACDNIGALFGVAGWNEFPPHIIPEQRYATIATVIEAPVADYASYAVNGIPAIETDTQSATSLQRWGSDPQSDFMIIGDGDPVLVLDEFWDTRYGIQRDIPVSGPGSWRMFYTYPQDYVSGNDVQNVVPLQPNHALISIFDIPDYPGFFGVGSDKFGRIQKDQTIIKARIDGRCRFVRHPTKPWLIVPAWNNALGCEEMTTLRPAHGCLKYVHRSRNTSGPGNLGDLVHAAALRDDYEFEVFSGETWLQVMRRQPGAIITEFAGPEFYLTRVYWNPVFVVHNGHATEGAGADATVFAMLRDLGGAKDYAAFELVAFPARVGLDPDVPYNEDTGIAGDPERWCISGKVGDEVVIGNLALPDGDEGFREEDVGGYVNTKTGFTSDRIGSLSTLAPGAWILCLRITPNSVFSSWGDLDNPIGTRRLNSSQFGFQVWIDQRPRCAPWALPTDVGAVPGSIPDYALPLLSWS